jgi:Domain of unknown function (DUF932)
MELFQAHNQWANRPADQQFESVQELYDAAKGYAASAREANNVSYSTLRADVQGGDVVLVGKQNVPARLTHWAFGQLSARADAPASYLRTLPATLAVQNINHGLRRNQDALMNANLLFHQNGSYVCRAVTSEKYERIWNYEVAQRMLDLVNQGWEPARPDVRVGDGRAALYCSDHDMFGFLRLPNHTIKQPVRSAAGEQAPMYKGLIYGNSEVGGGSLWAMSFLYNYMCGNHIIWGASGVVEFRAKHVGTIRERTQLWAAALRRYADSSMSSDEYKIAAAAQTRIAATKEQLLDLLFGKRSLGLSRKTIEASYNAAIPEQDGDPLTVWGFVQGATRHSQTIPYADERMRVDRAVGKVLSMVF